MRTTIDFIAGLCAVMLLAGCGSKDETPVAIQPVVAAQVAAGAPLRSSRLSAEIVPRYTTTLSFRTGGKILERRAKLGDQVKAGQVLAHLDLVDLHANETAVQARLDAAQHHVEVAEKQLQRDQLQAERKLIAPVELERSSDAYALAVAQRDEARQQLAIAATRSRDGNLSAERDGVITAEFAEAGQNVAAGQPVYELAWHSGLDASCDVPETLISRFTVGQPASVNITALPGAELSAHVREIATAADPQKRTWKVKLSIDQPPAALRPGMNATVTLASLGDGEDALPRVFSIPATALFHDADAPAVWVVAPGSSTLELRRVSVDRFGQQSIDITSGLHDGDVVVLQGPHTVHAGQKVRVVAPRPSGNAQQ